jgi:site-specific recombinase XerD
MRTSYSLSFYCRPSKVGKTGEAPLELSIIVNGQRVFLNLPVKFKPSEFNKKHKPEAIQTIIYSFRQKAQEAIADLLSEGLPITASTLRDILKTGGIVSKTIENLTDEYLKYIKPRVGHTMCKEVYRKYELTKDTLISFFGKDKEIVSVKPTDIEALYNELKSQYKDSTSGGMMTKVKTMFKFAFANGYIKTDPTSMTKVSKGEVLVEYLTPEELSRLTTTELPDKLEKVRTIALVQLYTGTAYIDAQRFDFKKTKEVDGITLYSSTRQKTKVPFTAIVLPQLKEILEPYGGKCPQMPNQVLNRYLKELAFICKIDKNLHTHIFRKTYATNLLHSNIPISTIQLCMGHTTPTITAKVYAFTTDNLIAKQAKQMLK